MNIYYWIKKGFFNKFKDGDLISDSKLLDLFLLELAKEGDVAPNKNDFYWFRKVIKAVGILEETDQVKVFKFNQAKLDEYLERRAVNEFD